MPIEQKRKKKHEHGVVVIAEKQTLQAGSLYAESIKEYLAGGGTIKVLAPEKECPFCLFDGLFEEFSYLFV